MVVFFLSREFQSDVLCVCSANQCLLLICLSTIHNRQWENSSGNEHKTVTGLEKKNDFHTVYDQKKNGEYESK